MLVAGGIEAPGGFEDPFQLGSGHLHRGPVEPPRQSQLRIEFVGLGILRSAVPQVPRVNFGAQFEERHFRHRNPESGSDEEPVPFLELVPARPAHPHVVGFVAKLHEVAQQIQAAPPDRELRQRLADAAPRRILRFLAVDLELETVAEELTVQVDLGPLVPARGTRKRILEAPAEVETGEHVAGRAQPEPRRQALRHAEAERVLAVFGGLVVDDEPLRFAAGTAVPAVAVVHAQTGSGHREMVNAECRVHRAVDGPVKPLADEVAPEVGTAVARNEKPGLPAVFLEGVVERREIGHRHVLDAERHVAQPDVFLGPYDGAAGGEVPAGIRLGAGGERSPFDRERSVFELFKSLGDEVKVLPQDPPGIAKDRGAVCEASLHGFRHHLFIAAFEYDVAFRPNPQFFLVDLDAVGLDPKSFVGHLGIAVKHDPRTLTSDVFRARDHGPRGGWIVAPGDRRLLSFLPVALLPESERAALRRSG